MGTHFSDSGFARGWFVVAFSDELKPGDIRPLRYFDQEIVLFRTEAGEAKILNGYCPHMGAHLGYSSKVVGETIQCGFHAWRFNGEGRCVDVPYAKKIPPKGHTVAWPVQERSGMIFVYHDADGGSPTWEIPELPEVNDDSYTNWDHEMVEVKTHPHAIVENVADTGHFIPVHGTHVESFEAVFDGHLATQVNSGVAYPLGGGKDNYKLRATYHGPGIQITHMDGYLKSILINAHTPIEENLLHLRFAVLIQKTGDEKQTEAFSKQYIANLRGGFFQDIEIWEHKTFLEKPALCDGDGPVMKLRRWYRQFYRPEAPAQST